MQTFEPSGSAGVDALLSAALTLSEQPELKDTLQFEAQVLELQTFRRELEKGFRESLRLSPRTSLLEELGKRFDEEFERFRGGGRRLESYLRHSRREDLEVGCQRVHQAVTQLLELSRRLSQQERRWQEESGPGLSGQVKFLLSQTQSGTLQPVQTAAILETILQSTRQLKSQVEQAQPENSEVAASLQDCTLQVDRFIHCLQRVLDILRQQKTWELPEAGRNLLESLDRLSEVHQALMKNLHPPVLCTQCSLQQPGDRPHCSQCGARLPLPVQTVEVPSVSPESRPRFQFFLEIEQQVQAWEQGQGQKGPCLLGIQNFRQRIQAGRRQMERDPNLQPELKQALVEAAEATEAALQTLAAALEADNRELATHNLGELLAAEEKMVAARQMSEEAALHSQPNS